MKAFPSVNLVRVFLLEILREKWFFGAFCVAIAIFLLSLAMGALSFDEKERIVFHISLSAIHLVGLGLAVILGIATISKEVERQTCLLILARPLSRAQFLFAKGAALALFLLILDIGLGCFLGLLMGGELDWLNLFSILFATWLEHLVVLSCAITAGLFLGRAVAGLFTVGVFLLGQWLPDLDFFAKKSGSELFLLLSKALQVLTPHLYEFNQRSIYFLKSGVTGPQLMWNLVHASGWTLGLFVVASVLWRRKDLV